MNEIDRIDQFVVAKLGADAALTALVGMRIYKDQAPDDTDFPIVIFRSYDGPDTTANGGRRVLVSPLYQVFGVDVEGGIGNASNDAKVTVASIADRVDAVLQAASGAAGSDAYVAQMLRERTYDLTSEENGQLFRYLGAYYRAWAYAT